MIVVVVAMVALAGCSSGGSTTTAPGTDAPDSSSTTVPGTDAPNGATTTSGTDGTTTDGSDSATTTDGSDGGTTTTSGPSNSLVADHAAALESAGSFTSEVNITQDIVQDGNKTTVQINQWTAIDTEANKGLRKQRFTGLFGGNMTINTSSYTSGDTTYMRAQSPFQGTQYLNASAPYNESGQVQPVNVTQAGGETYISQNITWSEAGTTTFKGVSVTKYTADGEASFPGLAESMGGNLTIESVNAQALVDDDGVVRHMTLHVSGTQQNGNSVTSTIELTTTEVGSTTVQEPSWISKA